MPSRLDQVYPEFDATDRAGVQGPGVTASEDGEPAADTVDEQLASAALPAMKEQAIPA